jgi:serine protease Do
MRGFGEIAERLRRSTAQVHLEQRGGTGSGVVWTPDGLILTNAHVARGSAARVELWDGRMFEARVVARDPWRDLATLRVASSGLEAATPGDSAAVRPGELVIAIGNPLGFAGALSTGTVHSVGQGWIRANVRLMPGNSGGPLANARGEVVGINTAVVNGLGVAVPVNAAIDFVRRGGRPILGVTLRPQPPGLLILEVDPKGAAATASLRPGDILLTSFDELGQTLASGQDVVRLRFLRGDRRRVREVFVRLSPARAEAA